MRSIRIAAAVLPLALMGAFASSSPSLVFAVGFHKAAPDPCGFRYAAWTYVQEEANYVQYMGGSPDSYTAGKRYNYLVDKLIGIEDDYHFKSKTLDNLSSTVAGDLQFALDQYNSGDTSGYQSGVRSGGQAQGKEWGVVKAICPWKGKARTWTGWLNQYGMDNATTRSFTVHSSRWGIDWDFDCGDQSGNFIVNVYRNGSPTTDNVNELSTGSGSVLFIDKPGSYYLQVISECVWHVKATTY